MCLGLLNTGLHGVYHDTWLPRTKGRLNPNEILASASLEQVPAEEVGATYLPRP